MYIKLLNGNDTLPFFKIDSFSINMHASPPNAVVSVAPDESQAFMDELSKLGAQPKIIPKPEEYQKQSLYHDVAYSLDANISIYIWGR